MEDESTKEKLLQASGVRQEKPRLKSQDEAAKEHLAQMELVTKTLIRDVKTALSQVTQAHDRGEWMIDQLKRYCQETLPKQMVQAIDEVAEQRVQACLAPLKTEVENARRTVEGLQRDAAEISRWWFRDLALGGLFIAMVMSLAMFLMVRFYFLGDGVNEAKRYELWGRKIEKRVEAYPPKEKAKLYNWMGGKP